MIRKMLKHLKNAKPKAGIDELQIINDEIEETQKNIARKKKRYKRNVVMDQDSQSTDSLFDYFYVDKERVNAITAQLFLLEFLIVLSRRLESLKKTLKSLRQGCH